MHGRALWEWSYEVLSAVCDPVVVVVPADEMPDLAAVHVVAGGDTRQASVSRGLAAIETEQVVVHDAARPLVTAELIGDVVAALDAADGAFAAIPLRDTLAHVRDDAMTGIVPRAEIVGVQTPQAFWTAALKDSHARAAAEGIGDASDDAQLLVHRGYRVVPVPGDERNLKITYPSDMAVAEMLAATSR